MIPVVKTIVILLMSFNIRYDNPNDGANSWDNRKEIVVNIIENSSPDLLGLQEVMKSQLEYLEKGLTEYSYFGEPRSEKENEEYNPIFFKKNKFELLDSDTFWLSETPDEPSLGWDAALNRIVTWGEIREKETGKILFHFNTHFDHEGEQAKLESVKLLKAKIKEIAGDNDYVVTGDLNFDPSSRQYKKLTNMERSTIERSTAVLGDASQIIKDGSKVNKGTFNGFDKSKDPIGPIDYILVGMNVAVKSFNVVDTIVSDQLPSDHFPVEAELEIKAE